MSLKLIGVALVASIVLAQSQAENTPKFEVTSVKLNKSPDLSKGLLQFLPGGRFVATNIPLIQVIAAAWDLALQSQRLTLAWARGCPTTFTISKQPQRKVRFHRG